MSVSNTLRSRGCMPFSLHNLILLSFSTLTIRISLVVSSILTRVHRACRTSRSLLSCVAEVYSLNLRGADGQQRRN
ncbi:hypothetical protein CALVIDRAFT_306968 [Calocera viscosa TUFC12733]|uniref:Uncharacterized protein n=1 Tax=Calocera viscosa (strain TUFC12733) TaxID=1330018 RepID=A0A167IBV6_CALVF|nr:hypothetical protein CALVIDRAFT_306968 [Calocera viscosa TUFC12733]